MTCSLIVTIDTEEDGAWDGSFRRAGHTVRNVGGIERFQTLCDAYGVRPTYLVDTPVLEDESAVERLRGLQDAGRCEVGAHLHPWCGPPWEEETDARNSYLCNLPERLQREKLVRLTEAMDSRFGRRPTSFRAGRYGLDAVGARILAELGYVVDSSVIPFSDFSPEGGPDFNEAPWRPYYVGGEELCQQQPSGRLLEVPVSVGYSRADFCAAHRLRQRVGRSPLRHLRLVGILDRLGLVRRIKFSPEQADARDMNRLVDLFLRQGMPCAVMMFHSSSLLPGQSPYVRDESALERFYGRLDQVFEYCLHKLNMPSCTLGEFARQFGGERPGDLALANKCAS